MKNKIFFSISCFFLILVSILGIKLFEDFSKTIELKDYSEDNINETLDEYASSLLPFDIAHKDIFESCSDSYEQHHILLKMDLNFNGNPSKDLRECGITSLHKILETKDGVWWKAFLSEEFDAKTSVNKARLLDDVIMADFDYVYITETIEHSAIADVNIDDNSFIDEEYFELVKQNELVENQWYLNDYGIKESWNYLQENGYSCGGSSSIVVAVIDTGVDYTHPDLKANMWINPNEIFGNGIDDDSNGYVDDIYGVNTIADNGNADGDEGDPMDDHGHGTHVAGIIGASNNKEGIVGIAYNTKIMAIKAGQASGTFNQSDIAEAILYAYSMGADVINMSFGGELSSVVVQEALIKAYTSTVLVASAGNNGRHNEFGKLPAPIYPAALPYVIGVMSVNKNGVESAFTNYDSKSYTKVEYEVYAPGEEIYSTLPNKRYGYLSGTSMAAPIVSATAALLRTYYTDFDVYPSKYIMGQICASGEKRANCNGHSNHISELPFIIDVYKAFVSAPIPNVRLLDYYLFDTKFFSDKNNDDGVVDAGETIGIGITINNHWGKSKNTIVTIEPTYNDGYITVIKGNEDFGEVGTYSNKDTLIRNEENVIIDCENPLIIKIDDDCPNDYLLSLNVKITYLNGLDDTDTINYTNDYNNNSVFDDDTIEFWVRNGVVLPSQITEDMVLTSDNYYIIPNSTFIPKGVTVSVEAGTQIQFWSDDPKDAYADTYIAKLIVEGEFITYGEAENPIQIFPSNMMDRYAVQISQQENGFVQFNYTIITNGDLDITSADHCLFNQTYQLSLFKKELINGQVTDSLTKCGIDCYEVTNSIFYKVGGRTVNPDWRDLNTYYEITGKYDTCIFVDSDVHYGRKSIYSANENFELYNSVLTGNHIVDSYGFEYTSFFNKLELYYDKPTILKVYDFTYSNNPNINSLYFEIDHVGTINLESIRRFANTLGGDICCLETHEEMNQIVYDTSLNGVVGFDYYDNKWVNGKNLEYQIDGGDRKNCYLCINGYNSKYYWVPPRIGESVIIELPKESVNKFLQNVNVQEELQNKFDEFYFGGNFGGIYGNAILNNYNDTNVEHWLRFVAESNTVPSTQIQKYYGLSGNYWGTNDREIIEKQVVDFDDYHTLVDYIVGDYAVNPPSKAYPFVTKIYLLNSSNEIVNRIGNEKFSVVVEFNRDMDVNVPLSVKFGSYYPYADYEVSGSWLDNRKWVGEYKITSFIEGGRLYFNVNNGQALDDSWLKIYETPGRFGFDFEVNSAQAMIMQGIATDEGINLTWYQDEFETLLGYNVYRSTAEDGYYERLNDYVLSFDEKSFFDSNVEPGVLYYYNFTVVKTDLSESKPSGKIVIRSKDTMAPNIYHSPVRTAYTENNLIISATIIDNLNVDNARIYYRKKGDSSWKSVQMNEFNDKYIGVIKSDHIETDGLEYYIEAFDGVSYTRKGSKENPYYVVVKLSVNANSLGDVNCDGTISVLDAQMMLLAINDMLNLSDEQFIRADLNGNGTLESVEALKILDYVSGKITTIL